jgi:nucleoside-diphosphate-sugar epimerase
MSDQKILVTGATGFIGGRLVEKLILYHAASVRALVRDFAHASRLSRFNLEMVGGGIADAGAVDRAVAGCDTVFHCAHDFSGKNAQQNLDGTRNVAEACLRHRVRRLVHVSTISVYEPLQDGDLDESSPAEPCGWIYPDNKLAIEQMLLNYWKERGLPVVVLQPTIVYGPFAKSWTIKPIKLLRDSRVALPQEGLCNAVYVDDVVDALILAAGKQQVEGERFLISGAEPVSWREFFGAFERMLGFERVTLMSNEQIEQSKKMTRPAGGIAVKFRSLREDPRRIARQVVVWPPVLKLYRLAQSLMGEEFAKPVAKDWPAPLFVPEDQLLALYGARTTVKIDKARRLLGYEPTFDFERGMNLTAQYVKWAKL